MQSGHVKLNPKLKMNVAGRSYEISGLDAGATMSRNDKDGRKFEGHIKLQPNVPIPLPNGLMLQAQAGYTGANIEWTENGGMKIWGEAGVKPKFKLTAPNGSSTEIEGLDAGVKLGWSPNGGLQFEGHYQTKPKITFTPVSGGPSFGVEGLDAKASVEWSPKSGVKFQANADTKPTFNFTPLSGGPTLQFSNVGAGGSVTYTPNKGFEVSGHAGIKPTLTVKNSDGSSQSYSLFDLGASVDSKGEEAHFRVPALGIDVNWNHSRVLPPGEQPTVVPAHKTSSEKVLDPFTNTYRPRWMAEAEKDGRPHLSPDGKLIYWSKNGIIPIEQWQARWQKQEISIGDPSGPQPEYKVLPQRQMPTQQEISASWPQARDHFRKQNPQMSQMSDQQVDEFLRGRAKARGMDVDEYVVHFVKRDEVANWPEQAPPAVNDESSSLHTRKPRESGYGENDVPQQEPLDQSQERNPVQQDSSPHPASGGGSVTDGMGADVSTRPDAGLSVSTDGATTGLSAPDGSSGSSSTVPKEGVASPAPTVTATPMVPEQAYPAPPTWTGATDYASLFGQGGGAGESESQPVAQPGPVQQVEQPA